jgi:dienelactone hydrolase
MPARGALPDPLRREADGAWTRITTPETWEAQRERLGAQLQYWIYGELPPAPDAVDATVLDTRHSDGATARDVRLEFGPEGQAHLSLELLIPDEAGPFPVFMTQWNHRKWAEVALERGYMAVIYAAADRRDDSADYREHYPEYDFQLLARRAWATHRAVDYVYTLPEADTGRIGLTGHSRNGKQVLLAAAFDERIDAVVPSSAGSGGVVPARLDRDDYYAGDMSFHARLRRSWFHPRWRFFVGRENRLPVDANSLVSLVAPRACMLFTATHEATSSSGAVDQVYDSAMDVYEFLDVPDRLALQYRQGDHGTATRDVHTIVDFFDQCFERGATLDSSPRYHGFDYEEWAATQEGVDTDAVPASGSTDFLVTDDGEPITTREQWESKKPDVQAAIQWSIGERPPRTPSRRDSAEDGVRPGYGREDYVADIIGRPSETDSIGRLWLSPYHCDGKPFGGELYYPRTAGAETPDGEIPAVVWLHPFSFNTGYGTGARSQVPVEAATDRGLAIFAYDQMGFGTRTAEAGRFYDRYPNWSKMGKLVADVQSAVRTLRDVEFVDADRIYVLGYSLGATVGLYAAALDEQIRGVASVCGVPPLRASDSETERASATLTRLTTQYGLQPRLGAFLDDPERIPFDFHEVLALVAPRPLLVYAPQRDWTHPYEPVRERVALAREVYDLYGASDRLSFHDPDDVLSFDYHEARLALATRGLDDAPSVSTRRRDFTFDWLADRLKP